MGIVIAIGVYWAYTTGSQPVTVENNVIEKEVQVEVDRLSELIESALNASSTAHEADAQKAYDAKLKQLRKEKELEVIKNYREQIEVREVELEKETKLY